MWLYREWKPPFQRKTVFACFAEKRDHLVLLVKRFQMKQMEAVHALISSFVLVTPCFHASREEEMYQSNSTNELVVPNALMALPYIWGTDELMQKLPDGVFAPEAISS